MPTPAKGWSSHVKGAGELSRSPRPDVRSDGINHKLFIGFRPLIVRIYDFTSRQEIMLTDIEQVLEAFDSRKATFLTLRDWQVRPFHLHAPSDMQDL